MGILRTDKISGLETPTAVTGSVSFDGTDDALIIADHGDTFDFLNSDFTVECWIYPRGGGSSNFGGIWSKGQPYQLWWKEDTERIEVYASSDGSNYNILNAVNSGNGSVPANQWSHIAHTREGDTFRIFVNGILTSSATSSSTIFANTNAARISDYDPDTGTYELDGEISNLRVLKGTALYTANFTPPTHALEVIKDTIILCCNNPDSVTASAFAGIGTAYAITTAGNPTVATRDPGLTRDFTYGTEFRGVTTFDTQGYFVPPSGTTEQRGRGRGVFSVGTTPNDNTSTNNIDYITIATLGNSQDFGDTTESLHAGSSGSDSTRGLFSGGAVAGNNTNYNTISYITIATTSNAVNFGDLSGLKRYSGSTSDKTRTVIAGGKNHPGPTFTTIEYVTTQALGDAQTFGDLSTGTWAFTGTASSPTRGIYFGGSPGGSSDSINTIVYVTIQSLGDAQDFGDLTNVNSYTGPGGIVSSTTRGIRGGGGGANPFTRVNTIDYVTMATLGNAQDFGDLSYSANGVMGCSSLTRGIFAGGKTGSGSVNTIEYVTIASTGNAQDFGDMRGTYAFSSALSDSHGGLS